MSGPQETPPGVNPAIPSVARMYDYYLGGKDHYESDRVAADKVIEVSRKVGNDIRLAARSNRAFLGRAVRAAAEAGVRQFLDIGTGLPTQENVHQVVLRHAPEARIVYVDNDPSVLAHARALLADNPSTTVIDGDLTAPDGILGHPGLRARIDFTEPVAVIFCAILQFIPDHAQAASIVARFRDEMAPGSHLVISHPYPGRRDDDVLDEVGDVYTSTASGSFTLRDLDTITGFFAGTELLPPGITPVETWRHGDGLREDFVPDYKTPCYLCGVARKP